MRRLCGTGRPPTDSVVDTVADRSHLFIDGIVLALATTILLPKLAKAFGFGSLSSVLFAVIWLSSAADRLIGLDSGRYRALTWTGMRAGAPVVMATVASTVLIAGREWVPLLWRSVAWPVGVRAAGAILGAGLTVARLRLHRNGSHGDANLPAKYSLVEPVLLGLSLFLMTGSVIALIALLWPCWIQFGAAGATCSTRLAGRHLALVSARKGTVISVGGAMTSIRQACCRHHYIRRFGRTRFWLECLACGRATPGIEIVRRPRIVDPSSQNRLIAHEDSWALSAAR